MSFASSPLASATATGGSSWAFSSGAAASGSSGASSMTSGSTQFWPSGAWSEVRGHAWLSRPLRPSYGRGWQTSCGDYYEWVADEAACKCKESDDIGVEGKCAAGKYSILGAVDTCDSGAACVCGNPKISLRPWGPWQCLRRGGPGSAFRRPPKRTSAA